MSACACITAQLVSQKYAQAAQGDYFLNSALSAGNTALQKLDLEGKGLEMAGATALAQNIDADTGLRHLILTSNSLGDDGAAAVAPALHNIAHVRYLCWSASLLEDIQSLSLLHAP